MAAPVPTVTVSHSQDGPPLSAFARRSSSVNYAAAAAAASSAQQFNTNLLDVFNFHLPAASPGVVGAPRFGRRPSIGTATLSGMDIITTSSIGGQFILEDKLDSVFSLETTYCKDFECCGMNFPSLHELTAHYEEVHVTFRPVEPRLLDSVNEEEETRDSTHPSTPSPTLTAGMPYLSQPNAPATPNSSMSSLVGNGVPVSTYSNQSSELNFSAGPSLQEVSHLRDGVEQLSIQKNSFSPPYNAGGDSSRQHNGFDNLQQNGQPNNFAAVPGLPVQQTPGCHFDSGNTNLVTPTPKRPRAPSFSLEGGDSGKRSRSQFLEGGYGYGNNPGMDEPKPFAEQSMRFHQGPTFYSTDIMNIQQHARQSSQQYEQSSPPRSFAQHTDSFTRPEFQPYLGASVSLPDFSSPRQYGGLPVSGSGPAPIHLQLTPRPQSPHLIGADMRNGQLPNPHLQHLIHEDPTIPMNQPNRTPTPFMFNSNSIMPMATPPQRPASTPIMPIPNGFQPETHDQFQPPSLPQPFSFPMRHPQFEGSHQQMHSAPILEVPQNLRKPITPSVKNGSPPAHSMSVSASIDSNGTKRYRCPKPWCSKAYKNSNGLKYHLEHGNCELDSSSAESLDFSPTTLTTTTNNNLGSSSSLSSSNGCESDDNSSTPPTDIKITYKPYWCRVSGCGKKYKNLNGLKYHGKVSHPELDFKGDVKGHTPDLRASMAAAVTAAAAAQAHAQAQHVQQQQHQVPSHIPQPPQPQMLPEQVRMQIPPPVPMMNMVDVAGVQGPPLFT
ncbi:hypothetical protein BJ742DRAFT_210473 [Cladochytrium replicatum]|nr:hypothetical protein BJ742DRAFT_210473 [Cladochytrium replicatum]